MTAAAYAKEPLESLKGPIEEVVAILNDPIYQEDGQKEIQHEKIWEVIRQIFDFTEIAKRALARNWRVFTPKQRKEFTDAFTELLGNNYINKIQGQYQDERVIYLGQEMLSGTKALVKTKIVRKHAEIPANYRMKQHNSSWWIYDVSIEGVSLVKNYRTQFNKILVKESPGQLIERIKKKTS